MPRPTRSRAPSIGDLIDRRRPAGPTAGGADSSHADGFVGVGGRVATCSMAVAGATVDARARYG